MKTQIEEITKYIAYKQSRTLVRWHVVYSANTYDGQFTVDAHTDVLKTVERLSKGNEAIGLAPIKKIKLTPIFADEEEEFIRNYNY